MDSATLWVRASALESFPTFGEAAAFEFVLQHLADPEREVRRAAIAALVELHARAALPALENLASDADLAIRAHAARAIKRIRRD